MATAQVPAADLTRLSPGDFADDELDLPYYLAHFHRFANGVIMEGEHRGFIDISVWRREKDNRPHNARIMENCLALAFFYCTDRPWNLYRGHPAVKPRLEAALDFWRRIQSGDGRFSEYSPGGWNLAATAFATKFMGQTLTLLKDGPPIDPTLHQRVIDADRSAIKAVFTIDTLQEHGRSFTNQYANVWGGALAYLHLYPDAEIDALLRQRLEESMTAFQSPAGYFYEKDGPDWGYFLSTHHSDLHMAWRYAKGADLATYFIEKERRYYDWFSYNAVREPDASGFILNREIETRQQRAFLTEKRVGLGGARDRGLGELQNPSLAEDLHPLRAFSRSQKARREDLARARADLENDWPQVSPLQVGEFFIYSPYAFLHRSHPEWYPTDAQKADAVSQLPYLARDRFIHQRADSRHPVVFTYVRRPSYYAIFNSGEILSKQQRYGLGLLWHPQAGGLLQAQTATDDAVWGAMAEGETSVYEAGSFAAQFRIDDRPVEPTAGAHDLPDGVLTVTYPLGEQGEKTVTFAEDHIEITVRHNGPFAEHLPLLLGPTDDLELNTGHVALERNGVVCSVRFEDAAQARLTHAGYRSGPREVVVLQLHTGHTLTYRIVVG